MSDSDSYSDEEWNKETNDEHSEEDSSSEEANEWVKKSTRNHTEFSENEDDSMDKERFVDGYDDLSLSSDSCYFTSSTMSICSEGSISFDSNENSSESTLDRV